MYCTALKENASIVIILPTPTPTHTCKYIYRLIWILYANLNDIYDKMQKFFLSKLLILDSS